MPKPNIIILGGGISGLTLAYELAKFKDRFHIRLIEKSNHLGGWMDTDTSTGFFFERGPRIFRGSRSPDFLALTQELDLHSELIESSRDHRGRYLWMDAKLRRLPILSWDLIKGLLKDWRTAPLTEEDESVWEFACRRLNVTVAEQFFDPLVLGIYGGNLKELSMQSCFPLYKHFERTHGSLLKGFLKKEKFRGPFMFGFQRGTKSIVQRLQERTPIPFHLNEEVLALNAHDQGFDVKTSKDLYRADYLFSALPAPIMGKLLLPQLSQIPIQGVTLVNLGYQKQVLKKKGLGYLISSKEQEEVLGVSFDSNTFPQYNRLAQETRLTITLRDASLSDGEARSLALKAISKHLGIQAKPDVSMVLHAPQVFPQFLVGHEKRMQSLEQDILQRYPRLRLTGNYLYGVGVNDCVARAQSVAKSFLMATAS